MPRASRRDADQHRKDVIEAASRLFRERGFDDVSVPGVMAAAGLTHGAFYGQFASKEALAEAACAKAFEHVREVYDGIEARNGADKEAARTEFIKRYTAKSHRDEPGLGCPVAALAGDIARDEPAGRVRTIFADGIVAMAGRLQALLSRGKRQQTREETLSAMAMLVGGLTLARATKGREISNEILAAVRKTLLEL